MDNANNRPGCLAAILKIFGIDLGSFTGRESDALPFQLDDDLPFRLRDDFLSAAEFSFYKVLRLAVSDQAIVCPKVNLGDIFFVSPPNKSRGARNKIDRKHVDFLLCHPITMKPLVGIELDDSSHQRRDRVDRDQLVDDVFHAAELPLLRFDARSAYEPASVLAKVTPHLSSNPSAEPPRIHRTPEKNETGIPTCPKCGVPMVRRTSGKGRNKGDQFWGCTNYPRCKQIV